MKEIIHYTTAIVLLLAGIILAFLGFYMPPEGEIHDSVLWLFAQCLIYAGSVFGLQLYVRNKIREQFGQRQDEQLGQRENEQLRQRENEAHNPPPSSPAPLRQLPYMPSC